LSSSDADRLKSAAQEIHQAKPGGELLRSEHIASLLGIVDVLAREKVFCRWEKAWVKFWDPACGLWLPR
jgi:hypothetical protein